MSSINKVRFATLAQSLAQALNSNTQIALNGMGSTSLLESGDQNNGQNFANIQQNPSAAQVKAVQQDQKALDNLLREVQSYISEHKLQNQVQVFNEARGVQITMRDVALFNTGQAVLLPGARDLIKGLTPFFRNIPNNIVVEGYTDNQPIDTPIYPSNWELSAARAMSVVHFLSNSGIEPERLSGTGYGQYHNVAPNNTAAGRQANRRVNIVVLRNELTPGTSASLPSDGTSVTVPNVANMTLPSPNSTTP